MTKSQLLEMGDQLSGQVSSLSALLNVGSKAGGNLTGKEFKAYMAALCSNADRTEAIAKDLNLALTRLNMGEGH